jgi:hypothetical protein
MLHSCTQSFMLGVLCHDLHTKQKQHVCHLYGRISWNHLHKTWGFFFFLFSVIFGNLKPFPYTLSLVTSICSNQNIRLLNSFDQCRMCMRSYCVASQKWQPLVSTLLQPSWVIPLCRGFTILLPCTKIKTRLTQSIRSNVQKIL